MLDFDESFNPMVLNGRSKSDVKGEFTFVRGNSCSVIDYCFVADDWIYEVSDFKVHEKCFSDHMPISIVMKINNDKQLICQGFNELTLLILMWRNNFKKTYQDALDLELDSLNSRGEIVSIEIMQDVTRKAAPKISDKSNRIQPKQKWFGAECLRARKKVFSFLKLFRR